MLAVARRSTDCEDLRHVLAACELALDDADLILDRAERGHELQFDLPQRGSLAHAQPGCRRFRCKPLRALVDVIAREGEARRFAQEAQAVASAVTGRNAEFACASEQCSALSR